MVNIDLLIDSTRDLFRKAYDGVKNAVDSAVNWISDKLNDLESLFSSGYNSAKEVIKPIKDAAKKKKKWVSDSINSLNQAITDIQQKIEGILNIKNAIINLPAWIFNTIADGIRSATSYITSVFDSISETLSFAGPLAPLLLVVFAGGMVLILIWAVKKTIGKYIPFI